MPIKIRENRIGQEWKTQRQRQHWADRTKTNKTKHVKQ